MDLDNKFRYAVRRYLPQTHIVADPFHVKKYLNEQIDKERRLLEKSINIIFS